MTSNPAPAPFFRTDALTGCRNLLAFADWLIEVCATIPRPALSLVALDMNAFWTLAYDPSHGDAVLRWVAMIIAEEYGLPPFRTGGDEFVFPLSGADFAAHAAFGDQLRARLDCEAERFGLKPQSQPLP